ncbi:hypothetical protein GH714_029397 [Hevea brasiliensis]|uniref:Protein kinase domain-containing protein n=1 Tax=Hevea brasiliensis TaxID=3981 RepID=A0A6A6NJY1_HEVBR|nr:hypothetical protein GH714_029397 [Hevea brasiliensis]
MKPFSKSLHVIIFLQFCFSLYLKDSLCADNIPYVPIENTALDCGSSGLKTLSFDGRNWTGDVRSKFVAFNRHTNSTVSMASSMDPGVPQVPYETARLFYSEFTYIFNVTPGPKFVRLYFYPCSYSGLDDSKAPSSNASDAFAFVNGIEVVSMPLNLYVREDASLPFVGYPASPIRLDNTSALETVYRINVGGNDVSPESDTGMFRTWIQDDKYILGSAWGVWAFDLILMLHFCELYRNITKTNQRVFSIYINNQTAQDQADVIAWSGGQGIPVYKDYIAMFPQVRERIQDLWVELHPNTKTKPQYYDAILNGVEIFKLSNYGGDLAGLNPPQEQGSLVNPSSRSSGSSKKRLLTSVGCSVSGVILAFLIMCALAFWITAASKRKKKSKTRHAQSLCRYFTVKEIKAATNNFDEAYVIGTGGFGVVYKGYLDSGVTAVAIKRGNQASIKQGFCEFLAEIKTLSLLRHNNVVSLMGYCHDEQEMILVYEYMPNGTLFEHLHFVNKPQKSPLSWIQRLQICIGAAQGLCYLHTGLKLEIVHRDVKTSNILLDDNWVVKISDFGLSKIGLTSGSTKVKGSIGYLDPEYCRFQILSNKSDVYSFGVVLLEVLSAKFVVNPSAAEENNHNEDDEDALSFVEWALNCHEKAEWDQIIDPHLEGKISPASLAKFMEITQQCLAERGLDRPSMNEVLWNLELALELQMHEFSEDRNITLESVGNSDPTPGVEFSEIMNPVGR